MPPHTALLLAIVITGWLKFNHPVGSEVVTATVTGASSHRPWDPKTLMRKAPRCLSLSLSHTHTHSLTHSRTSSRTHTLTPPLRELPVASIVCCHGNGMGRPFLQAMGFKPHSLGSSLCNS